MSEIRPTEDLADLYENAPCGYVSLSPDARIVKVNRTLADWLGISAVQLLGRPIFELLSFGGRIAYETHLAPLLRLQGFVHEIALDLLRSDGTKIPVIANAAEKRGSAGQHHFTRLTLFKAVDRRTYERSLVEARVKAEAAARAEQDAATLREQFIAVLGHDLRNPLAAIAAGVRMLEEGEALSERGRLITREMGAGAARASALIDDVLDFARGRLGGGLPISPDRKQPLTPVLAQVVAEVRAIFPDRSIEEHFALEEPIYCDRARIGQLAQNLLSNAVTHGAPDIPIKVEAVTDESCFVFSVANGGEPIPAAAMAQLFQPFFRGAVRKSQHGLGLGLFIVSEIAKAHGGTMTVSSGEEETRFTFTMPLAAQ
ncbi:PAS domain-containing sensor histidine kinase [Sphingosinicella sp. CPCC 101087]|uniref:PAS domain-containing sensor histidine kinase n=1 Tax=Sphingosinicella sp. CPCC 101087 TaxID=2497754 RepID=UPI00101BD492|nr:PAS domain-containing sensor histidine kinase [Sphingosinicella sp. CPCC 101087]